MSKLISIVIAGDSIYHAAGDSTTSPQGQGDYLNGTSPSASYPNIGNYGWPERALGSAYPYFNLSVNGKLTNAYTAANMVKVLPLIDKIRPTHVIIAPSANGFFSSRTGVQLVADTEAVMTLFRNRYGGIKCIVPTQPPVSNGTDWASKADQSLLGSLAAIGGTPPWSLWTDDTGATGRSYLNTRLRGGFTTADLVVDVSSVCEDLTDTRLWISSSGASTKDGLHPNQRQHTVMAAYAAPLIASYIG